MLAEELSRVGGGRTPEGVLSDKIGWQSNSVRRALAILELLSSRPRHLSLSEISRKLTLPKSTTCVLLSTLETMGYVTRDTEERRYVLSLKAFGLGFGLVDQVDLSRRATPVLKSLSAALKVTAHIAVLDGDQALFVSKIDSIRQPCCDIYPGRRTNLQCTAVGKVLLAYVSKEDERGFLARHRSIQHTKRTIVSPEELLREISGVRKSGYARDDQEEALFVRCLAVPIFDQASTPVAALGITGTLAEIRPYNIEFLAQYLKQMSERIYRTRARASRKSERPA
jgi:DNA-binding IclR family transcriptional regulator